MAPPKTPASVYSTPVSVYNADEIEISPEHQNLEPVKLTPGEEVRGKYFNGCPMIAKVDIEPLRYTMSVSKNVMVKMRDAVELAVDVYQPDAEAKWPTLLSWGMWGKDNQEVVLWLRDYPQRYYSSPWWDGGLESGDPEFFVSRGYAYVIPDPRGIGKSGGGPVRSLIDLHRPEDIYDLTDWIVKQPWSYGKVGMLGPSSFAFSNFIAAANPHPNLAAIFPIEAFCPPEDPLTGIVDASLFGILHGGHIHDSTLPVSQWGPPTAYDVLGKERTEKILKDLANHPDVKYHPKFRTELMYPRNPIFIDYVISTLYPDLMPHTSVFDKIEIPTYIGMPAPVGGTRIYWGCYRAYEKVRSKHKKFMMIPCKFARPWVELHEEVLRWFDHWLKEIDNGIMDEPPIKVFVKGINKWKTEDEWPPRDVTWAQYYLHPGGNLDTTPPHRRSQPADVFFQPMPLKDPTVYTLNYRTQALDRAVEVIGPAAFYLEASIDQDDVHWLVQVVEVTVEGKKRLMTEGWLAGSFTTLDEKESKPWAPIPKRQRPVPVPKGERIKYGIYLGPLAHYVRKGHSIEVIIRTTDDMYSRLAAATIFFMPRMVDLTANVHHGLDSYLLLPTREL